MIPLLSLEARKHRQTTAAWDVRNREAVPDFDGQFLPEHRCQNLLPMTAEIA
jgi:hypothetical protein